MNNPFINNNNILPDDFVRTHIDSRNSKNENQHYIVIDSRDRNNVKYPTDNYGISNYRIDLSDTYRRCCKIELVYAFIPGSQYMINDNNNVLTMSTSLKLNQEPDLTKTVDIKIPKGDYSIIPGETTNLVYNSDDETYDDSLSKAITSEGERIVDLLPSFKCRYLPLTDNYEITIPDKHSLIFKGDDVLYGEQREKISSYKEKTIGAILGFDMKNYSNTSGGPKSITSDFRKDYYRNKNVVLSLKNLNTERMQTINTYVKDSFAILPVLANCSKSKQPWPDEKRFAFEFTGTYPDIDKLDIQFTDYDGNLIDFNGHNHTMIFCITTLNNHLIAS